MNHYSLAKSLATLLDSKFAIGKRSFGIDPLLDLVPGLGVVVSLLLSLYIVWVGITMKLPQKEIQRMIFNVVFDFILGLIPLVGLVGDFFYKANIRNIKILEKYKSRKVLDAEIVAQ